CLADHYRAGYRRLTAFPTGGAGRGILRFGRVSSLWHCAGFHTMRLSHVSNPGGYADTDGTDTFNDTSLPDFADLCAGHGHRFWPSRPRRSLVGPKPASGVAVA